MSDAIPDEAVCYAGLVMTQAASVASVLREGELICPFIVVTKGEDRQSIEFEASTQDEAGSCGWASLDEYRALVDLWAFAREGVVKGPSGKEDVLVVAVRKPGMEKPASFRRDSFPQAKADLHS